LRVMRRSPATPQSSLTMKLSFERSYDRLSARSCA
jgi:hypothetical protein